MNDLGKRRSARKAVKISGIISDLTFSTKIKCMVLDASKTGCRIKIRENKTLPDELWLNIPGMKSAARGKIVWRRDDMAGIQFSWDGQSDADRRAGSRQIVETPAIISDRQHVQNLHGAVQNISESGCLVIAEDIADMPDEICIKLETEDQATPGTIVWRNGIMAGVEFLQNAETDKEDDGQQADEILEEFMTFFQGTAKENENGGHPAEIDLDDIYFVDTEPPASLRKTKNADSTPWAQSGATAILAKAFSR